MGQEKLRFCGLSGFFIFSVGAFLGEEKVTHFVSEKCGKAVFSF